MGYYQLITKLNLYKDIISNIDAVNAYHSVRMFPFSEMTEKELFLMSEINCIEVYFEGTHGNNTLVEELCSNYEKFELDYFHVLNSKLKNYLFVSEYSKMVKNRIRSYKGLLSKEPKAFNSFAETEISFSEKYSIIAAVSELSSDLPNEFIENSGGRKFRFSIKNNLIINNELVKHYVNTFLVTVPCQTLTIQDLYWKYVL